MIYMRFERLTKEQLEDLAAAAEEEGEKPDPNGLYFVDKIFGGVVQPESGTVRVRGEEVTLSNAALVIPNSRYSRASNKSRACGVDG